MLQKPTLTLPSLRILQSQGAYLDTVSPGEVFMGLISGYTPDRIMFTGTSVRNDELKMLADANITVNIDSLNPNSKGYLKLEFRRFCRFGLTRKSAQVITAIV